MAWRVVNTLSMTELREHGCARVKITRPVRVHAERLSAERMGLKLGKSVACCYRYPWLYVVLGEKLPARQRMAGDCTEASQRVVKTSAVGLCGSMRAPGAVGMVIPTDRKAGPGGKVTSGVF